MEVLGGGVVAIADAMLVSLKQAVATDQSSLELADLPLDWQATRENAQSPQRQQRYSTHQDKADFLALGF